MKTSDITSAIAQKGGITALNAMQQAICGVATKGTLILLSPTGTGKTLAFAIAMLRSLDHNAQAVVLAPSRELAAQIYDVVRPIAIGLKSTLVTGGRSVTDEAASLAVIPNIIIGTPGRLLDHANRENIDLTRVQTWVIDEYDKCLELGFEQEMARLARKMPKVKFMILTSATALAVLPDYLPDKGMEVVMDFSDKNARPGERTVISHIESVNRDKLETLVQLIGSLPDDEKTIVFANHRESAERIYNYLKSKGFSVGLYHGGLEQNDRENALELLTNGSVSVLVSTDLAARGVDIDGGVENVIHYHLPPTAQAWTHRNGRTARIGAQGKVHVITAEHEDIPDYVVWDKEGFGSEQGGGRYAPNHTLYFNLGKKEKISRGDIVGFLTALDVPGDKIGRIALRDHNALVAVDKNQFPNLTEKLKGQKIKGKSVRVTLLK